MHENARHRLFIVAGEASGDQLGAQLIKELMDSRPDGLILDGVGGLQMASAGISSKIDIRPLAVIGLVDGLRAYPYVKKLVKQTVEEIIKFAPDMVILIDSWGFTLRVARQIKMVLPKCKLIKYVGPQVFATRPGRARITANIYDHLLTIHSFDHKYFEEFGLPTTFVGNPALSKPITGNPNQLTNKYNLEGRFVLCVLFGSRPSEVSYLMEPFLAAITEVKQEFPKLVVLSPVADNLSTHIRALAVSDPRLQDIVLLSEREKNDVFLASDLALACSGTVTLQLAQAGVPMVIGYRFGILFSIILRSFFFKAKYANLINLAADDEIIPELMLEKCTAQGLAKALISLLNHPEKRTLQNKQVATTIKKMQPKVGKVAGVAARTILTLLD